MKRFTPYVIAASMAFGLGMSGLCSILSPSFIETRADEVSVPAIVDVGGSAFDAESGMGGAPVATIGASYSAQVNATGGNLTYSAGSGSYMTLPDGLSIDAETGLISGTCTETELGHFNVYLRVENEKGTADGVIGMYVVDTSVIPAISTAQGSLGTTNVGAFTQIKVSVQNNANYMNDLEWSLTSGAIPSGMLLQYTNQATCYLSGKPTVAGTYEFNLRATNGVGYDEKTFSITVESGSVAPNIVTGVGELESGIVGKPYEFQFEATGTDTNEDPIIWSFGNGFDQDSYDVGLGLYLSKDGLLSGTPTEAGQLSLDTIYCKNSKGTDYESPYVRFFEDGTPTAVSVSPEVSVVQRGKSKQFTPTVTGYGDVSQEVTWAQSMYDPSISGWLPYPTSEDTTLVDGLLTIGADETRDEVYVVAISAEKNTIKGRATVTVVDAAAEVYSIAFDSNGGSGTMTALEYVEGYEYTLPECAFTAPEGYHFLSWSVSGGSYNDVSKAVGDTITLSGDTVVKALWEADPTPTYSVTYKAGDGTGDDYVVSDVEEGSEHALISFATAGFTAPEGYQFKCWSVASENKDPGAKITVTADVSVTAMYELIPTVEYTVSFSANGGSGTMNEVLVEEGNEFTLPGCGFTAPEHKVFKAWLIGETEYEVGAKITVTANVEIKAVWTDLLYTVSFDTNGGSGTMASENVVDGSEFTLPECGFTAPEGKQFKAWLIGETEYQPGDKITVTSDVTIGALWQDVPASSSEESSSEAASSSQDASSSESSSVAESSSAAESSSVAESSSAAESSSVESSSATQSSSESPVDPGSSSDGLSGGAIAGIAIGSVAVAGLGGFSVFWFVIKKKSFADLIAIFKKK